MKGSMFIAAAGFIASAAAQGQCGDCANVSSLTRCSPAWKAAVGVCVAAPCSFDYGKDMIAECAWEEYQVQQASEAANPKPEPTKSEETDSPVSSASSAVAGAVTSASDAASSVVDSASSAVESAASDAASVTSAAGSAASSIVDDASSAVASVTSAADDAVSSAADDASSVASDISSSVEGAVSSITGSAASAAESASSKIVGGGAAGLVTTTSDGTTITTKKAATGMVTITTDGSTITTKADSMTTISTDGSSITTKVPESMTTISTDGSSITTKASTTAAEGEPTESSDATAEEGAASSLMVGPLSVIVSALVFGAGFLVL